MKKSFFSICDNKMAGGILCCCFLFAKVKERLHKEKQTLKRIKNGKKVAVM